jgi:hypothetical protein
VVLNWKATDRFGVFKVVNGGGGGWVQRRAADPPVGAQAQHERATVDACAGLSGEGDDEAPCPGIGEASFGAERRAHDEGNGIAARRHK